MQDTKAWAAVLEVSTSALRPPRLRHVGLDVGVQMRLGSLLP